MLHGREPPIHDRSALHSGKNQRDASGHSARYAHTLLQSRLGLPVGFCVAARPHVRAPVNLCVCWEKDALWRQHAVVFATGLLPCLTFMYVSRFMALSIVMNRPMLAIPAVKVLDILFARAFWRSSRPVLPFFLLS